MKTLLIGIGGQVGHGKDTLANLIVELAAASGVKIQKTAFARSLKEFCMAIFGLSKWQVYDPAGKQASFGPVRLDDYVAMLSRETGLEIERRGLVANSAREILQMVGTEYVRSVAGEYWVERTMRTVEGPTIIADMRFDNEAAAIRFAGGYRVRIIREGHEAEATHASEQITDDVDETFVVRDGEFERMREIAGQLLRLWPLS